jgi:hypothetical protein
MKIWEKYEMEIDQKVKLGSLRKDTAERNKRNADRIFRSLLMVLPEKKIEALVKKKFGAKTHRYTIRKLKEIANQ